MSTITIILAIIYLITISIYSNKGMAYAQSVLGTKYGRVYWYASTAIAALILTLFYHLQWNWLLNICLVTSIITMIYSIKYVIK